MWTISPWFATEQTKECSFLPFSLFLSIFKLHYVLLGHYPLSNLCKMERALALTSNLSCNQSFPPGFHWVERQLSTPSNSPHFPPSSHLSPSLSLSLSLTFRGLNKGDHPIQEAVLCDDCANMLSVFWIAALLSQVRMLSVNSGRGQDV